MTFHNKLRLLWVLSHAVVTYVLLFDFSLISLILAILWLIITNIGSEAGAHRLFTHKSYETSPLKRKLLIFLQTFVGEGSILAFVGVHRQHHAFSDQEKDPHSPSQRSLLSVIYWINPVQVNPKYVADCIRDKWIKFQHEYYFYIHAILSLLILVDIKLYFVLVAFPTTLMVYGNAATNIVGHSPSIFKNGYRNYNTDDNSINIDGWLNVLLMGGALQNNHHGKENHYTNKFKDNDHDSMGWIIEKFLMK